MPDSGRAVPSGSLPIDVVEGRLGAANERDDTGIRQVAAAGDDVEPVQQVTVARCSQVLCRGFARLGQVAPGDLQSNGTCVQRWHVALLSRPVVPQPGHPSAVPGRCIDFDAPVRDTPGDAVVDPDGLDRLRAPDDEQAYPTDGDWANVYGQQALGLVVDAASQPLGVEAGADQRPVVGHSHDQSAATIRVGHTGGLVREGCGGPVVVGLFREDLATAIAAPGLFLEVHVEAFGRKLAASEGGQHLGGLGLHRVQPITDGHRRSRAFVII